MERQAPVLLLDLLWRRQLQSLDEIYRRVTAAGAERDPIAAHRQAAATAFALLLDDLLLHRWPGSRSPSATAAAAAGQLIRAKRGLLAEPAINVPLRGFR